MSLDPLSWLTRLADLLRTPVSRRGFLRWLGVLAGAAVFSSARARRALAGTGTTLPPRAGRKTTPACDLAVVTGEDPAVLTRKAIETLGGMARFVHRGDVVVVKPNIGWDRTPELAGNTNPAVVAELVRLSLAAGARRVKVFDNTCNDARRTYASSGIGAAAKAAGAQVFFVDDWKFFPGRFPAGSPMAEWPVFRDAVECDCFINVPVAKHHRLTRLTLSLKNLMGVCGGIRGIIHQNIDHKLVEMARFIHPDLTVIDAYRILLRNGPTGGDPEDVATRKTVIAGVDPVLADAYAATLFDIQPEEIGYIKQAAAAGLGNLDVKKAKIVAVQA